MGERKLIGYRVVREHNGARQWLSGDTQAWCDWPCDLWDSTSWSSCSRTAKAHGARVASVYLTVRKSRRAG